MKKLYVLTRLDLDLTYRAVQGGHALAEYMLKHPTQAAEWGNHTLIYLQADNEEALNMWAERLGYKGINFSTFKEPDLGHETTALACYCEGKIFSNLKLLGRK